MSRPVILAPAAQAEIDAAYRWYLDLHSNLGAAFLAELDRRFDRIAHAPRQFPIVHRDVRRALLRRFPYAVIFRERPGDVEVIACFHASRDPSIWRARS